VKYAAEIVSSIPEKERIRVYYAHGRDGLETDPAGSAHTRLLEFCGGINVADVSHKIGLGSTNVSMEQILLWDPDLIILGYATEEFLANRIMTDSRWSPLKLEVKYLIHKESQAYPN